MIDLRQVSWKYLLIFLLPALSGCGAELDVPERAPVAPTGIAPVAALDPAPAAPPPVAQVAPPPAQGVLVAQKPAAPPPKPVRPTDLAAWTPDDFRSARTERDQKLAEAIRLFGVRSAGDAAAIPLLTEILEPPPPAENAPPPRGGIANRAAPPPDLQVVNAAIAAVGMNTTPDADALLEKLLSGAINPGVSAQNVINGVLNELVNHSNPVRQEMLLAATLTPEKYRPAAEAAATPAAATPLRGAAASGTITPVQLRRDALTRLKAGADADVRKELAVRLSSANLLPDELAPFHAMLLEARPDNVPAQIVLFNQTNLEDKDHDRIRLQLGQFAMAALDNLLGIPEGTKVAPPAGYQAGAMTGTSKLSLGEPAKLSVPDRSAVAPATPGSPAKQPIRDPKQTASELAAEFWNPAFAQTLIQAAQGADDINKALPDMLIAATAPDTASRAAFAEITQPLWETGPGPLKSGTIFGEQLHDPGLLLVLKQIPRKEDPARVERRTVQTEPKKNTRRPRKPPVVTDEEKARFEWMQASEEFVYVLTSRFRAAALANRLASSNPTTPPAAKDPAEPADETAAPPADDKVPGETAPDNSASGNSASENTEPDDADETLVKKPAARARSAKAKSGSADSADKPEDDAFGTASQASATGDPHALPVELHEDAKVVAQYRLSWPADLAGKAAGVEMPPMIVHYIRIEETNRVNKLLVHYQKFLKGARLRTIDRGRWIDHVDEGTAPGHKRSIDVMVAAVKAQAPPAPRTPGAKEPVRPKNPEEPLIVEILSIEIPDPLPPPAKESGTKPKSKPTSREAARSED